MTPKENRNMFLPQISISSLVDWYMVAMQHCGTMLCDTTEYAMPFQPLIGCILQGMGERGDIILDTSY